MLQNGEKSVKVEFVDGEMMGNAILFYDKPEDRAELDRMLSEGMVQTMHSREATLEMIFHKLTGRELG